MSSKKETSSMSSKNQLSSVSHETERIDYGLPSWIPVSLSMLTMDYDTFEAKTIDMSSSEISKFQFENQQLLSNVAIQDLINDSRINKNGLILSQGQILRRFELQTILNLYDSAEVARPRWEYALSSKCLFSGLETNVFDHEENQSPEINKISDLYETETIDYGLPSWIPVSASMLSLDAETFESKTKEMTEFEITQFQHENLKLLSNVAFNAMNSDSRIHKSEFYSSYWNRLLEYNLRDGYLCVWDLMNILKLYDYVNVKWPSWAYALNSQCIEHDQSIPILATVSEV
jgi:hypothetical protein